MTIYSTGTVSVTNGDAVVTGSGTAWAVALIAGGIFSSAGLSVPILSVDSDTSLTLAYAWPGTTAAGAAYAIARENSEAANIVDLNDRLNRVLVTLSLAGITPNDSGTLTERDALTLGVGDKGFLFLHAELGYDFEFYRWSGSAWDGPFATRGTQGASGLIGIWRGPWLTATAYYVNDAVSQGGSSYICVTAHTSGTFATDLAASKWQLVAQKGDTGAAGTNGTNGAPGVVQSIVAGSNVTVDSTDPAHPVVSASGTPVETAVHAATSKATPVDADEMALVDSAASWALKKLTWANLKGGIWTAWGALINGGTAKTTPVDADLFAIADSAASNATKKLTWANLKATLKSNLALREVLTANRTYYVATTGSDSNNGLTVGAPFLTIQKAFDTICTIDLNGFTVTVQIADGTYTSGLAFNKPWVGGNLVFQGNNGTPANVLISVTSANAISSSAPLSGVVTIQDMKIQTTTGGTGILHNRAGLIQISNLNFGACVTAHIQCFGPGADILVTGNYSITAGSVRHFEAGEGGRIVAASRTVTLTGTPAFSFAFASGQRLGLIMAQSMTFSGAATGPYYNAANGGGIYTGGGGATYFPGSTAGTATSPGWYA